MRLSKKRGLTRFCTEFFAIFTVLLALGLVGHFAAVHLLSKDIPALAKLHYWQPALFEISLPVFVSALVARAWLRRSRLSYVAWTEPEYVPPEKGGRAPTYAPPLDTDDDVRFGSALSAEPEPFYDLHIQPRISRLWWLMGVLTVLGIIIIIAYALNESDISTSEFTVGFLTAAVWAVSQEYVLRGFVVARARTFIRRDHWVALVVMLASTLWILPLALTARTHTYMIVIALSGPITGVLLFSLRRMFNTLWAPITAQFLFILTFFVLLSPYK